MPGILKEFQPASGISEDFCGNGARVLPIWRPDMTTPSFDQLSSRMSGELVTGGTMRKLYATDASDYQEMPLAVAFPRDETDVREIILFANENRVGIIPRTAGTSLAGQVVGGGIVVDLSRHFGWILDINKETRRVRVQPGVVRNELNFELAKHGLVFGPRKCLS
jgi:FAD/FMN-containing dehydrogenase